MARCAGSKPDGTPCERIVGASESHCYSHDPERSEERRRNASKAARSKPLSDLVMLKQKLVTLGDDVLAGKATRGDAAVAATCYGTAIKCVEALVKVRELEESRLVETGLKVKEQEELIVRLEALEEVQQRGKAGGSRGA